MAEYTVCPSYKKQSQGQSQSEITDDNGDYFTSQAEVSKSVLSIEFVLSLSYINYIWKTQYELNTQYRFGHLWSLPMIFEFWSLSLRYR